ncbi:bark storage protein B-like [Hibiscus syriacus]|uniref:bark storage protein B-like n=1 Tax=Hibiscus syriacus TaxID=106335 RepID=UPI001924D994|nr:bark storage protein B-like [Hibiscus syriacus]
MVMARAFKSWILSLFLPLREPWSRVQERTDNRDYVINGGERGIPEFTPPCMIVAMRAPPIAKLEKIRSFSLVPEVYGDGAEDVLALESNGDYTKEIGYLRFSDYNNSIKCNISSENLFNNVWYQAEEIFSVDGVPEQRQHAFWVPVNDHYFTTAERVEVLRLGGCANATCLPRPPMVVRVEREISSNIFVDNRAYRELLNAKFNATAIDMETAAVALVCHQQNTPFIAFRSLSDLAVGVSALSNEASAFASLAAQNAVDVLISFTSLLSS